MLRASLVPPLSLQPAALASCAQLNIVAERVCCAPSLAAPIPLPLRLQDVVLLDSIYGTWDSGNPSTYYNNLEAGSVNAGLGSQPTQHQRQELDISYK